MPIEVPSRDERLTHVRRSSGPSRLFRPTIVPIETEWLRFFLENEKRIPLGESFEPEHRPFLADVVTFVESIIGTNAIGSMASWRSLFFTPIARILAVGVYRNLRLFRFFSRHAVTVQPVKE
jgi:hypothetical protein